MVDEPLKGGVSQSSFNPFFDVANKIGDKALDVGAQIAVGAYNNYNAKRAAERQFERTMSLMGYQYDLNRRAYDYQMTQGPTLYRQGLTSAGYNPILPFVGGSGLTNASFGSSSLGSASLENTPYLDGNNLIQASMLHENIENIKSQTQLNNANSNLTNEKVITETYEQELKLLDKTTKQIENEWLPKRIKAEITERISNARAKLYDAITNRINANTGIVNANTNIRAVKATEQRNLNDFQLGSDSLSNEMEKYFLDKKFEAVKSILGSVIALYGIFRAKPLVEGLVSKYGVSDVKNAIGDQMYYQIIRGIQ